MHPHAAAPLSFATAGLDMADSPRTTRPDPAATTAFHEAFAKAHARPSAPELPAPKPPEARAKASERERVKERPAERSEARESARASTARRAGAPKRQEADAPAEEASANEAARAPKRDDETLRSDEHEGARDEDAAASSAKSAASLGTVPLEPVSVVKPVAPIDFSQLFGAVLPSVGLPNAATTSGMDTAAAAKAGAPGAKVSLGDDLGGASAATLHSLSDALARADHAAGSAQTNLGRGPAIGGEGLAAGGPSSAATTVDAPALSSEGRALVDAAAQKQGQAAAATSEAPSNGSAQTNSTTADKADHAATTASEVRAADASTGTELARGFDREGGTESQGNDSGAASDSRLADAFRRTDDAALPEAITGAFGADPRVQTAHTSTKALEGRSDQAKEATERILDQIERITELRNSGRDMVVATERGPVRVRIDVIEKQVSVNFRTDDDQLKAMLRSGLPALQASLERRGFAQSSFRFDGDASSDLMAGSGSGKHLEARAARDTLLGEVMVEPVFTNAAEVAKQDPRALLSVVA